MPEGTILDTILAHKRDEVTARRERLPDTELRSRLADLPPTRGFTQSLRNPRIGQTALIAEVKKASPTAGLIRPDFDPVAIAGIYEANGAACLSVLTDEKFFQGHDTYLQEVRASVSIPLLRKDFTIDPYQIDEARLLGADAILLIAMALTAQQISDYRAQAEALGLDVLVEVHNEDEMHIAVASGATLIGINSRNLRSFTTDLGIIDRLAPLAGNALLVAESGIKTSADVTRVRASGAHAVLVGETLMRSADIGVALRDLMG